MFNSLKQKLKQLFYTPCDKNKRNINIPAEINRMEYTLDISVKKIRRFFRK